MIYEKGRINPTQNLKKVKNRVVFSKNFSLPADNENFFENLHSQQSICTASRAALQVFAAARIARADTLLFLTFFILCVVGALPRNSKSKKDNAFLFLGSLL